MKPIVSSEKTSDAIGRPWWQVRRALWGTLIAVCVAAGAIWFQADLRAVLVATLVRPLIVAMRPVVSVDALVVLAFSTGAVLLAGWLLRRVRAHRPPQHAPQTA